MSWKPIVLDLADCTGQVPSEHLFRKAVQPMYDDLKAVPAVAALAEKIQAVQ